MIKVIAVDFGGVYFTWNRDKFRRDVSKTLGVDFETVKKAHSLKIRDLHIQKVTEKEYWDSFCQVMGKNVNHNLLKKITLKQFKPKKPVIDLIKNLRKRYRIVLLSNHTIWLDELDRKYGVYRNFDLVLSSHIVKVQKPDREIYELLIKKTKAKPQEIIFIEDTEENIEAAGKVGINTILFRNVRQLRRELASYGVEV